MDGTVTTDPAGRTTLRFERALTHPPERVWQALTDPGELAAWLAAADLEPRAGGKVELRWLNTDEQGRSAVARGVVSAWEPPRLLELDTDLHGLLRWELTPTPAGTRLVFIVRHAIPGEYLLKVLAGWHIHLDFLAEALDGSAVDWPNWPIDRWQAVHDRYAAAQ
jgi:uncharacterized protein YndB with AHSA1/START domain